MPSDPRDEPAVLEVMDALHEAGVALMRQNLRRRHPDESDGQIDARLRRWLQDLEERDVGPHLVAGPWPRARPPGTPRRPGAS
jgi:hypothetical protein